MSFIQKSDKYSEGMADNVKKGLFDEDLFVTMRFSHLFADEQYSNTMAFGNSRSWLYTGISQWERMVDTLKKWKEWKNSNQEKVPQGVPEKANFNPEQVDDIITRWKDYHETEPPYSLHNVVWVLNHGWRYNRNLMFWAHFFEPVHRAYLNGRYATDSRTFNALVKLGLAERNREDEVQLDGEEKKKGWKNPFRK